MTIGRRDGHGYLDAMEREHGVVGRLLAHGVLDKRIPPLWESRPEDFPLPSFVLEHATAVIVHSQTVGASAREAGFGGVNASKRIPELLRAFARAREVQPRATLLLVGPTSPGFDLDRRLQRLGLDEAGLVRESWVDEPRLWALMAGADVCVNLRH